MSLRPLRAPGEIHVERPSTPLASLAPAAAILVLVLALGALPRLINLGRVPLGPDEAAEALAAWSLWQPAVSLPPASPAYFSLSALLFGLLGAGDVTARLMPALFGLALIALPWLLRPQIGTRGALVAGLALAVSPLATILARTADGASFALFAGLLFFVAVRRYSEGGATRWLLAAAIALGFGLTTAPLFYSVLVTLFLARLAAVVLGPGAPRLPRPDAAAGRWAVALALGAFLAVALAFGWQNGGLGAAGNLLARWLGQFGLGAEPGVWAGPLLILVRYEPAAFFLGLVAILWAGGQRDELAGFLTYWMVAALLLLALQPGVRENSALIVLPASLLIGRFAASALGQQPIGPPWARWALGTGLCFLLGAALVSLARYARLAPVSPDQALSYLWIAAVLIALGAAVAVFVWLSSRRLAAQGALLAALAFLFYVEWGDGWWLGQAAANDTRTLWVSSASDDEAPLLARAVREVSETATRSEHDLRLWSTVESPVLRWLLRDMTDVGFGPSVPPALDPEAVISYSNEELALPADYVGSDYGLLRQDSPQPLIQAQALRGWLLRDAPTAVPETRVVFWVRQDLIR